MFPESQFIPFIRLVIQFQNNLGARGSISFILEGTVSLTTSAGTTIKKKSSKSIGGIGTFF